MWRLCKCMMISRWILLSLRSVADKRKENQNTHFIYSNPPPGNLTVYEVMRVNTVEDRPHTDDNGMGHRKDAIGKNRHTHTLIRKEYNNNNNNNNRNHTSAFWTIHENPFLFPCHCGIRDLASVSSPVKIPVPCATGFLHLFKDGINASVCAGIFIASSDT